ncbi:Zinc finger [Lecanosticta acicola]|uniref:Zinc finger n=1 Tax=Lecanosticta acicola TaxID=111012 RepID=A0AAI8Z2W8_9PEZI|nr:Zinc finger [Lecanosticta acicola]
MVPGLGPMDAPASFTARRPNASNLPSFELPPPPLSHLHQSYNNKANYSHLNSAHPAPSATTLTSVGNLLTPPSNGSADGLSPTSSGLPSSASLSSHGAAQPFTPSGSGMWPPPSTSASTPYGFQAGNPPQSSFQGRALFSPSLGSIVRGSNSPTASEALPPPPPSYDMPHYSQQSMPMSAPSLPAVPNHQQMMHGHGSMMGGQQTPVSGPVTHASPVSAHEAFARPPPTPTQGYYSQPTQSHQHGNYSYSGPSPIQHSPMSAGGSLAKMSPVSHQGPLPSHPPQPQYSQHRQYSYPMSGPVLSNVNNPSGQLALVGGGMPPNMMAFNSGHAAQMHAMYGHPHQQPSPQNDRPFRCDQCPQSFNRNHDLKRHKRIHLAVKPFPCGHCDKSFSRKDALKRHVLVKGCGKAQATADVKEMDSSVSPKSESVSPVVTATA